MLTDIQKETAVGFFKNRSDDQLVERLEWFENNVRLSSTQKKPYNLQHDQHHVEILYHVLTHRGFFDSTK